jgi:hypothetical protein
MTATSLPERVGRWAVEGSLVLFAAWTLVYQVALVAGLPSTGALVLSALLGSAGLVLLHGLRHSTWQYPAGMPSAPVALLVAVATVSATAAGLAGHRTLAVCAAVVGACLGLAAAARAGWRPRPGGPDTAEAEDLPSRWLWPAGWAAALASAGLASVLARPDGDDAYFVNLSTWVAERGHFPLHDTMISADLLPANAAHSPPVHSVEALIGALARVLDVEAGTFTYVVVPPLATLVAVLVITRLVQDARVPAAPWALLGVVGYLWTTGGSGYSLGNFFAVRIWQGKAMLVSAVLPLVVLFAARLIRRGTARHHLLFGSALVATVGMSNTAVFLVPVLVAGLVLAALALRQVRGALRLVLWTAYPAAVGVIALVLVPSAPSSAELAGEGFAARVRTLGDPLVTVPGRHGIFVVTALAVGMGALGLRERTLRVAALGALVTGGLALLPPLREVFQGVGLASVLWRMWWVVPIPLLVAGLVGAAAGRLRGPRPVLAMLAAAAVALVPLAGGRWVGSPANARLVEPMAWKVPRGALTEARFVESVSGPGDTVLVPWDTARVLAALTVDVQPVSARRAYLPTYAGAPEAHAGSRERLQEFVDRSTPPVNDIAGALDELSVDTACVGSRRGRAVDLLEANGFSVVGKVNNLTCLRR